MDTQFPSAQELPDSQNMDTNIHLLPGAPSTKTGNKSRFVATHKLLRQQTHEAFPRYLTVKRKNEDFSKNASDPEIEFPESHKLIEDLAETRYHCDHPGSLAIGQYECSFCSYKTKKKGNLNSHMLIHMDASKNMHGKEITNLTEYHMQDNPFKTTRHSGNFYQLCLDVKSAQNQEKNIMEYQESERCLDIKSEELDIKEEEDECDRQFLCIQ
ncbi:hypothetical protein NQ318_013197 [Aromia moschata]|uniref:C2H2-type domain-containing protein n=1 Tax=Aromia moschata TaxID=1265417 RepID=A0AAV8X3S8_9CUCU|nr:hypothetical protein NQ318_013197 [Aromia moschata]